MSKVVDKNVEGESKKRPAYPAKDGTLKETPKDFDPKKFAPLKKSAFVDEIAHTMHKADLLEMKAKALREDAKRQAAFKNPEDRKKAKKATRAVAAFAEAAAELAAKGIDLASLLKGQDLSALEKLIPAKK
jgi:hypothetical protein